MVQCMSTQKLVTTEGVTPTRQKVEVRQCNKPSQQAASKIYQKLGLPEAPPLGKSKCCPIKVFQWKKSLLFHWTAEFPACQISDYSTEPIKCLLYGISLFYRANQTVKRMLIFIGQPIYSLKDICLRDDLVEKTGIFGIQKGILFKRRTYSIFLSYHTTVRAVRHTAV